MFVSEFALQLHKRLIMARGIANKSILSFNAGELSPKLDARTDLDKYSAGCRTLQNAFVEPYGAAIRRAGTQYIASTKVADTKARLIGFKFSTTTNFILEFGVGYVRFFSNGAQVLDGATIVEVATPYGEADLFELQTTQINDVVYITHPDWPTHKLSRLSDTSWTMAEMDPYYPPFLDENVDESLGLRLNDAAITTDWVTATAYVPGDVRDEGGVIYLCLIGHTSGTFATDLAAGKWEVYNLLTASSAVFLAGHVGSYWQLAHLREASFVELEIVVPTTWALTAAWVTLTAYEVDDYVLESGTKYKCLEAHTSGTFATDLAALKWEETEDPDFVVGDVRRNGATNYVCLEAHIGSVFATDFAAGKWAVSDADLTSATIPVRGDWNVRTYGVWIADVIVQRSLDGGATWDSIRKFRGKEDRNVDATGNQVEDALFRVVLNDIDPPTNAGPTTPRVVIEVVDAYIYGLVQILGVINSTNCRVRIVDEPLSEAETPYWAEGAWSDVRGYPRAVTLHEQRLCFGGTAHQPQTVWGSVTGDFENFQRGTLDTDSFAYTLGATEFNAILWFVSQGRLLIGTTAGEWSMWSGDQGLPITPSAVKVDQQSAFGSKVGVPALLVNDLVLFVQRQGRKVRELSFSYEKDGYVAPDLTLLSEHVTKGGIVQFAYQAQASAILWAVTGEGVLIGMTYEREQNVFGWHRHPTDGFVESVATIYGTNDDEVWMVVRRTVGGATVRYVERINPAKWTVKADCFFVDCGKTVLLSPASTAVTGLAHLNGKTVQVLADGNVETSKVVAAGAITLDHASSTVQVGLPFETIVKPMRIDTDPSLGNSQGLVKQVKNLVVRVLDTLGLKYGDGKAAFETLEFREIDAGGDAMDSSPPLFTGDKEIQFPGEFETEGDIVIKQDQPLPLTLIAIVTKHQVTGK